MAKEPKIKSFPPESCVLWFIRASILNPVTRWHCKYLQYTKQVGVSYKRLHGLKMPVQQIERLLLQPFRVATVTTTMEISTTLESTAIGGVLPRTMKTTHTTGT